MRRVEAVPRRIDPMSAGTPATVFTPPRILRRRADGHLLLDRSGDVSEEAQPLATDRGDDWVVCFPIAASLRYRWCTRIPAHQVSSVITEARPA